MLHRTRARDRGTLAAAAAGALAAAVVGERHDRPARPGTCSSSRRRSCRRTPA